MCYGLMDGQIDGHEGHSYNHFSAALKEINKNQEGVS